MSVLFRTLLVANRGEIACRVLRTAHRLGINSVAVHSQADAGALHVKLADTSVCIGAPAASASYLNGEAILEAAHRTGATAIHPGYGFLSENADFAQQCRDAKIVFVGPSPEVIRLMGEKQSAIKLMQDAGVKTLPSSVDDDRSEQQLIAAAARIGFPVIVKPNAGGGGKGMHIVTDAADMADVLAAARREAGKAFGDQRLMIEKYLPNARHIEVQVFADTAGNVVHLFERDCSIQRRHQKVIEETPAPNLTQELRASLLHAAVRATSAIDYVGAGTIEFLVSGDNHYFLEMNTRLQVEHPVTELTTGQDLVEWQLRVAAGEALPLTQADIVQRGHAIEARVYAEQPERDFLPATGNVQRLRMPTQESSIRIDSGIQVGDEITVHYDPLLLKLSSFADDRTTASALLRQALFDTEITGVATNLWLLGSLLSNEQHRDARLSTGLLESHMKQQARRDGEIQRTLRFATVLYLIEDRISRSLTNDGEPSSPWAQQRPWRLNAAYREIFHVADDESSQAIEVIHGTDHYVLSDNDPQKVSAAVEMYADGLISARLDGKRIQARVWRKNDRIVVRSHTAQAQFSVYHTDSSVRQDSAQAGGLTAPLPGTVVKVLIKEGQHVDKHSALMVIEAMKMEHTVNAPRAGLVEKILYAPGDQVEEGAELVVLF